MKVRTDFVTNSSSSSFIFKENILTDEYKETLKESVRESVRRTNSEARRFDEDAYQPLWREDHCDSMIDDMNCRRIREYEWSILSYVYAWYQDDLCNRILGDEKVWEACKQHKWGGENEVQCWKNIDAAIKNLVLTDEMCSKLCKMLACYVMFFGQEFFESIGEETEPRSISADNLELYMKRYIPNVADDAVEFVPERFVTPYMMDNTEGMDYYQAMWFEDTAMMLCRTIMLYYEEISQYVKQCDGVDVGDLLEELFEAEYMYFYDEETNYLIAENLPYEYGCCHMG